METKETNFQSSHELLSSLEFCVIDLETTGGNPETEKIIEVGMIRIEKRKITEERNFLINPHKDIPEFVQKLTGIKNADVQHSPKIEEVIDEICHFIGDSVLVAHNTSFDIPFLNGVLKKLGRPSLDNKVICTNIMTKYLIPEIMSSNLSYMSEIFNIPHSNAHRAVEDAKATANLLLKYMEIFEEKKIRKVNQLYYPRNKFELDRIVFEEDNDLNEIYDHLLKIEIPCVLTIKGDNGVILTVLPIKNPSLEINEIKEYMNEFRWSQIHIKLCGPFIQGLMTMNSNFIKIPEQYRIKTVEYLKKKHDISKGDGILEDYDFIVTPHLISGQFYVYSFLNFTQYSHLVFKFPAHKKKLHQFLQGQVTRFETLQKQKRKFYIQNELRDIFLSLFKQALEESKTLYLPIKMSEIKEEKKYYLEKIEALSVAHPSPYNFPTTHL